MRTTALGQHELSQDYQQNAETLKKLKFHLKETVYQQVH